MPIATWMQTFEVADGAGGRDTDQTRARWSTGSSTSLGIVRQKVTLTASVFTALTVPSGAKSVIIKVGSATSLTIKGITGDQGIPIAPASNPLGLPVVLPLGASPSIGILNGLGSDQSVEVIFSL